MSFLSRLFGGGVSTNHISCSDYKSRFMDGKAPHLLVDVRTPDEFSSGYIPGAKNIALQEIGQKMNQIPKDKPVVIYCRSGNRSAHAAQMLMKAGYEDVYDLGGIIDWAAHGLPVKTKK